MNMKLLNMRTSRALVIAVGAALLGAAWSPAARAASIKGRIQAAPASAFNASSPINISKGTAAWVYYGYNGQADGIHTDAHNAAKFSALVCPTLSPWTTGPAPAYITFTGASNGASRNFVFVNGPFTNSQGGGQSGNHFSFTTKLMASSETLRVYLISYNSKSNISVSLTSGGSVVAAFHKKAVVLPTRDGDGTGANHGYGILTLQIHGGSVGSTVTIKDTTNISGVSATSNANIGIQAASVTVGKH